jgi:hypothetical protein
LRWSVADDSRRVGGASLLRCRVRFQQPRDIAKQSREDLSDHRANLLDAWDQNEAAILAVLKNTKQLPQQDVVQQYEATVLEMVRTASLGRSIQEKLLFFEQLTQCIELGLCDGGVAHSTLHVVAREFYRQYYPYICRLRTEWNDKTTGAALERFVSTNASTKDICSAP